jgi:hypothetical protein
MAVGSKSNVGYLISRLKIGLAVKKADGHYERGLDPIVIEGLQ